MAPGAGKDEDLGDLYELLGVEYDASDKDIQTAYRKAALRCHPDKITDEDAKAEAAEKFEKLTRAKDLLLDPIKRAEVDRERKAREELQHRFAQEDAKRRKLREDLESRENAAAREDSAAAARGWEPKESAAEARKRFIQSDFAARIKAREAERTGRTAELIAKVDATRTQVQAELEAARVRVTWREGAAVSPKIIKELLSQFDLKSLEMREGEATAELGSREDALRAVLYCRERKHTMPFRISMAAATKKPPDGSNGREPAAPPKVSGKAKVPTATGVDEKSAKPSPNSNFEKDMLGSLLEMAAAQRAKRASQNKSA